MSHRQLTPPRDLPVFRGLVAGFTLVMILLGAAAAIAIQGARTIEDDTARIAREQFVAARLLNDLQAEQNTLALVLHRLAHMPDTRDRDRIFNELFEADRALVRVAQSAAASHDAQRWRQLERAVRDFSATVRAVLGQRDDVPLAAVARLLEQHDRVARAERELLNITEGRIAQIESRIEAESQQLARRSSLLLGACLALAILCAVLTVRFARRSIRRMEWQANELNRVSWHMLQGQEAAARRLSHELHDELGQALAAIRANLTSAAVPDWEQRRKDCLLVVDDAIANVREMSQLLRPVILDDFGLDAGLRWLTERFGERTGIRTDYASTFHERLSDEAETHLFRITQEALTNVARHSGAKQVTVELHTVDGRVRLSIEDDGRGLTARSREGASLGLTGMRARAAHMGGDLRLLTPPEGGLRIEVNFLWERLEQTSAEQKDTHSVG